MSEAEPEFVDVDFGDPEPDAPSLEAIADSGTKPGDAEKDEVKVPQMFSVWKPSQVLEYTPPKDDAILAGGLWSRGDLAVFVGQGGLGKSRSATWLALCSITGRPWLGLATHPSDSTWLLIGNENSLKRQQSDLSRMLSDFTEADRMKIEEKLRIHVLVEPEDADLDMTSGEVVMRLRRTLEDCKPDVIVLDPWGGMTPDEDRTAESRAALNALFRAKAATVPNAAILILAHARTGASNIGQAAGWSKANFLKGSKVLYSAARFVVNLAPGDPEDETKIVLACGKANNGPHFPTCGVVFDPQTFTYRVDSTFDLKEWQDDVDGKRTSTQKVTIRDVVETVREGLATRKEVVDKLTERTGASPRTVDARLKQALQRGYLTNPAPGIYKLKEAGE